VEQPWWLLPVIGLGVATWVAGLDIFYALPDEQFDRREGLKSAVVRLGPARSILVAKLLHGVTIPALAVFGWAAGFWAWYFAGVILAAGILAWEHHWLRPDDLSRLDAAFFTMKRRDERDGVPLCAGGSKYCDAETPSARTLDSHHGRDSRKPPAQSRSRRGPGP
jgi:hypothetical protein